MKNVLAIAAVCLVSTSSFGFDIDVDGVEVKTAELKGDFHFQPELETLIVSDPRIEFGSEGKGYFVGIQTAYSFCKKLGFESGTAREVPLGEADTENSIFIRGSTTNSTFVNDSATVTTSSTTWRLSTPPTGDDGDKLATIVCSRPQPNSIGVALWERQVNGTDDSESEEDVEE